MSGKQNFVDLRFRQSDETGASSLDDNAPIEVTLLDGLPVQDLSTTPAPIFLANATSVVYVASLVVKPSPGKMYGATGYNSKGTVQWIQLFDATKLPADGAIPKVILPVDTLRGFSIDFGQYGRKFDVGIVIANSTTGPTLTTGAADCWFDVQYI